MLLGFMKLHLRLGVEDKLVGLGGFLVTSPGVWEVDAKHHVSPLRQGVPDLTAYLCRNAQNFGLKGEDFFAYVDSPRGSDWGPLRTNVQFVVSLLKNPELQYPDVKWYLGREDVAPFNTKSCLEMISKTLFQCEEPYYLLTTSKNSLRADEFGRKVAEHIRYLMEVRPFER